MYRIKRFSLRNKRDEFTHATQKKNVDSILKRGLLGTKSHSKDSITNMSRNVTGSKKNLVYLSNDGRSSNIIKKVCDEFLGGGVILNISIPHEEFKKMKIVDNPELLGSRNYDDFINRYRNKYKRSLSKSKTPSKEYYDIMSRGTTVIEGNIPPEYIKESPKYIG